MKRTLYLIELATILGLGLSTGVAADLPTKSTKNAARGLQAPADERRRGDDPRLKPDSQSGAADFLVKGGTWLVLTGNVKLSIGGNFLNRGTLAPAIGPTVIFGGRNAQAETGFAIFPNLMKTGGGTLTLNNTVAISGTLILDNGNISLNGNNLEALSITGGSAASYVVTPDTSGGLIRPVATTSTLFPVGNSSFNPVSLRTGTGTDLFRVSVVDSLMPTTPNKQNALKRTWVIYQSNPPGTNGNIVLSVQWNAGEEGSQFDRSLGGAGSADGWRWNGTTWVRQNGSRFFDNGLNAYPAIDSIVASTLGLWTLANESGALPIQLASFTAVIAGTDRVRLDWTTLTEINNYGFEVQKRRGADSVFASLPGIFIPGHGTTNEPHSYSAIDSTAGEGHLLYRLRQIDLDGALHYSDPVSITVPTSVQQDNIPTELQLLQNFPNPFNPSTIIGYALPQRAFVTISIYNTLGQQVARLVNQEQAVGNYQVVLNAAGWASGVYFYSLEIAGTRLVKKLILMR